MTGIEDAGTDRPRVSFNGGIEQNDIIVSCDSGKSVVRQHVTDPDVSIFWILRADDIEGPPFGRRQIEEVTNETLGLPVSVPSTQGKYGEQTQ